MSLSNDTVWELRADGSDSNGGGFVSTASGTDRSQAASAFASGTALTVDGTTNTDVAPDGYTPVSADVGNIINITSGVGFTAGSYQIMSIQSGKWRFDRSPAAVNTATGVWALGGARKSPGLLLTTGAAITQYNTIWLRGGATPSSSPFLVTSNSQNVADGKVSLSNGSLKVQIRGYGTTRGDNVRAVVKQGVNVTSSFWTITNFSYIENLEFDGNKANFSQGSGVVNAGRARNCTFHDFATGATGNNTGIFIGCDIYNCSSHGVSGGGSFYLCRSYNNGGYGFNYSATFIAHRCIAYGNTTKGFAGTTSTIAFLNGCTSYGNGEEGFSAAQGSGTDTYVNCVAYGNTALGFANSNTGAAGSPILMYNCASGSNGSALGGTSTTPFTQIGTITLSANPFVNAASGDFTLNQTAGGGADLTGAGFATLLGGTMVSDVDIGAIQHPITEVPNVTANAIIAGVTAALAVKKNTALNNFPFFMRDSAGAGVAGATVTATRVIDGVSGGCANSVNGISNGQYKINLAATDLNGDCIQLLFTAPGCVPNPITILTQH